MAELIERLKNYGKSDVYPFHMPGHKRKMIGDFPNPFFIDITEIEGFDNLHHPEGILKKSMEQAARIYGSDQSYYLVNGSTCGILAAICSCTNHGGTILMAKNCHKSAYHGAILNDLQTEYLYPDVINKFGINGGIFAEDVEKALQQNHKIEAVFLVSPTYDGIVSDIESIANVTHKYKIPLIVDEAHGAHFSFADHEEFPKSALECGADIVIQSLHKTLPSLTQTAILHVQGKFADKIKLERYLGMFQSSSPSYVLMSSMEECIRFMDQNGHAAMRRYTERLKWFYDEVKDLKVLKILDKTIKEEASVFDWDMSKIVISVKNSEINGEQLCKLLRDSYHIELEMSAPEYVIALTSIMDTKEGFQRLAEALKEIDAGLTEKKKIDAERYAISRAETAMPPGEALKRQGIKVELEKCKNRISQEFVYLYPPGIPILAPGESITEEVLEQICQYRRMGLAVQGLSDPALSSIITVAEA